ncbi:LuxR C-terminal-related transcriptional regulator [Kitasatospora sp. NPDC050467]|uniref:LuxR C-terminal-related transcriptional regulator n=1 Tax=Kitasatospora sp. NPDC050467 TaxID=3364053 RepID=UPI00379EBAE2
MSAEGPVLSEAAARAYAFAVDRLCFGVAELADALDLDKRAAENLVAELEGLHLLARVHGEPWLLSPVPPESAAARLLAPMEQRAREAQLAIDRARTGLLELAPRYEAGAAHQRRSGRVELVADAAAVRGIIQDAAHRAGVEVLAAQPGDGRPAGPLTGSAERDAELLGRGVAVRTLYQHTARRRPATVAHAERVAELGGQARTVGDGLRRMLVFDRSVALLQVQGDEDAALVVREHNIIDLMRSVFEQNWLQARPFSSPADRAGALVISDELQQAVVALLAEGLDDRSIARRLGMSERTCQRHIAQLMARIGARSRFQLGYLVGGLQTGEAPGDQPARQRI